MSTLLRERARRGAAWLDSTMPGWHRRISTETLDIEDTNTCIIGQLFGDYNDWSKDHHRNDFSVRHGLHIRHEGAKNWRKQTAAWIEQVNNRLRSDEPLTAVRRAIFKHAKVA